MTRVIKLSILLSLCIASTLDFMNPEETKFELEPSFSELEPCHTTNFSAQNKFETAKQLAHLVPLSLVLTFSQPKITLKSGKVYQVKKLALLSGSEDFNGFEGFVKKSSLSNLIEYVFSSIKNYTNEEKSCIPSENYHPYYLLNNFNLKVFTCMFNVLKRHNAEALEVSLLTQAIHGLLVNFKYNYDMELTKLRCATALSLFSDILDQETKEEMDKVFKEFRLKRPVLFLRLKSKMD